MRKWIVLITLLAPIATFAQGYAINWHKIAGGGGTSSGGGFSVSGTIGQHDASGPLTGGGFALTGGFWSILSVVQTPGAPTLSIRHSGSEVILSWPNTGTYTLQQNSNLAATSGWAASGYEKSLNNGTNSVTITVPTGNVYFRLSSL